MAQMAQPWKHSTTGVYYLRREIPAKLRPAFEGKALWKVSLRTKDFPRAAILFASANAELEQRFEDARSRFAATGDPRPSQRDRATELVLGYFDGPAPSEGGLDGPERLLLARLELDRGLWNSTAFGCTKIFPSDPEQCWRLAGNAALFRGHAGTRPHLNGRSAGEVWRYADREFRPGARAEQVARVVEQVARRHGLSSAELPDGIPEVIREYLDRQPVGPARVRKPQSAQSRLRSEIRLMELFDEWKLGAAPSAHTAHEYEQAARDFIDSVGDIPVADIVNDDLLNYRDTAKDLPSSMPRKDRELPFTERVVKHAGIIGPRVSAGTLKKRVGGIQALLSHVKEQRWITRNEGREVTVVGYTKGGRKRRPFEEEELRQLLSSPLFLRPTSWRMDNKVTDLTLYWLFLIALGFNAYRDAVAAAGHTRLFPDLVLSRFDKQTKEASRVAIGISTRTSRRTPGSPSTACVTASRTWRSKPGSPSASSIRFAGTRLPPSAASTAKASGCRPSTPTFTASTGQRSMQRWLTKTGRVPDVTPIFSSTWS